MTAAVAKYPAGVEHLYGTMYRIRLSMIKTADGGFDPKATELVFRNPRWTEIAGKKVGHGFGPEEMAELREDIRLHGLSHPLRCRWHPYQKPRTTVPKSVQLVDGERRTRSLLMLVKDDAKCWDAANGEWKSARELYDWVECRVTEMTDEEALHLALKNNETSVQIGTGAQVGLVKHLRHLQMTDEQILAIVGKSPDWLLKTEKLFALPEPIFLALCEDRINRKVARALGDMPAATSDEIKRRDARFQLALAATDARIAKMEEERAEAEMAKELAEADLLMAEEKGDNSKIQTAKAAIERAQKRESRAHRASARPRNNITSGKDLEASGHAGNKPFTTAKIKRFLYDPACDMLKRKCLDTETKEPLAVDPNDVRLVKGFCELLETGPTGDPETCLRRFLETHQKRKKN